MTVRVAVRHPDPARIACCKAAGLDRVTVVRADVRDQASVAAAIAGADAVVNAVSAYVEKGGVTFEAVHVQGAETVAREAVAAGVARLVLVSGIGADPEFSGRLTSVLEGAANRWSSRSFLALRSFVQAPCSVRATRCSARSPTSRGCSRCCRSSAAAAPDCSQSMWKTWRRLSLAYSPTP